MGSNAPVAHFAAAGCSAAANYPLWKVSAQAQSGFAFNGSHAEQYVAAFRPPFRGMFAVISGMTWARAAIFYGSEVLKEEMEDAKAIPGPLKIVLPPLLMSAFVQICNQPLVRASITLQNPECKEQNVRSVIRRIYKENGYRGLWHGISAGILKTVPKYCTAIIVKDFLETKLPK